MLLHGAAQILDQENQVQWVRRRAFKTELDIPLPSTLIDRVNEQGTYPDQLAGLQDPRHRIPQQRAPEMLALMASIDSKATQQDDGYRLAGGQAPYEPRRRGSRHHRTGRECVIAGDDWICLGRDEYA
jgi:hypothetical protein